MQPPPDAAAAGLGALKLPLGFAAALGALALFPRIQDHDTLTASVIGAALALLAWALVVWRARGAEGFRTVVSLRPQHYLQAVAHTSIFVYWGMYWDPLRQAALLIVAQILFAYAFDILLTWSRGRTYTLGFGIFPIIYSTNLFLRFRDDWFYLQFAMVAIAFLGKEFIRWEREGRRVHIFNPSSLTLAIFSLGLIVTGTTRITWGEDIASLLGLPPQMYLFIFLVSLPGQFLFGVTAMTLPAVLTTSLLSAVFLHRTGTYYFFDSDIPIAVFLGMHLLFTDPSTSPRTDLGRISFGVMYGASVFGLYWLLGWLGVPTFYDKLLQVPLMNLMVRRLDLVAAARWVSWADPSRFQLTPRVRSAVYVSAWIVAFTALSSSRVLGDHHPGASIPFWKKACDDGRAGACHNAAIFYSRACRAGSGLACSELGILQAAGKVVAAPAKDLFALACRSESTAGCENAKVLAAGGKDFRHDDPDEFDLRLVLQEGRGPLKHETLRELNELACLQGWPSSCAAIGKPAPRN